MRGTNYTTAGIKAAIEAIAGWPAGATVTVRRVRRRRGRCNDAGFQVTFNGGTARRRPNQPPLGLTDTAGATGFVGETAKGGPVDNGGITVRADTATTRRS